MPNPETAPLLLRYSPWKRFLISIFCFGFASLGYVLAHFPQNGPLPALGNKLRFMGWYVVVIFGVMGLIALLLALSFHRGVAVEIGGNGILNRRDRWPLIPWEEIRCVTVRYVTLEIHPLESAKLKALPFDGLTVDISLSGLSPGESEIIAYLMQHHADRFQES
jgi:hypothetical protein